MVSRKEGILREGKIQGMNRILASEFSSSGVDNTVSNPCLRLGNSSLLPKFLMIWGEYITATLEQS